MAVPMLPNYTGIPNYGRNIMDAVWTEKAASPGMFSSLKGGMGSMGKWGRKNLGPAALAYGVGEIGSDLLRKGDEDIYGDIYRQVGEGQQNKWGNLGGKILGGGLGATLGLLTGNPLLALAGGQAGTKIAGTLLGNDAYEKGKAKVNKDLAEINARLDASGDFGRSAITAGYDQGIASVGEQTNRAMSDLMSANRAQMDTAAKSAARGGLGAGAALGQQLMLGRQTGNQATRLRQDAANQIAGLSAQRQHALWQAQPELESRRLQKGAQMAGGYNLTPQQFARLSGKYSTMRY